MALKSYLFTVTSLQNHCPHPALAEQRVLEIQIICVSSVSQDFSPPDYG